MHGMIAYLYSVVQVRAAFSVHQQQQCWMFLIKYSWEVGSLFIASVGRKKKYKTLGDTLHPQGLTWLNIFLVPQLVLSDCSLLLRSVRVNWESGIKIGRIIERMLCYCYLRWKTSMHRWNSVCFLKTSKCWRLRRAYKQNCSLTYRLSVWFLDWSHDWWSILYVFMESSQIFGTELIFYHHQISHAAPICHPALCCNIMPIARYSHFSNRSRIQTRTHKQMYIIEYIKP